jgi:hypothetical protein
MESASTSAAEISGYARIPRTCPLCRRALSAREHFRKAPRPRRCQASENIVYLAVTTAPFSFGFITSCASSGLTVGTRARRRICLPSKDSHAFSAASTRFRCAMVTSPPARRRKPFQIVKSKCPRADRPPHREKGADRRAAVISMARTGAMWRGCPTEKARNSVDGAITPTSSRTGGLRRPQSERPL